MPIPVSFTLILIIELAVTTPQQRNASVRYVRTQRDKENTSRDCIRRRLQGTGRAALTSSSLHINVTILPDLATRVTFVCTLMSFPCLSVTISLPGMAIRACASSSAEDHRLDSSFRVSIKPLGTYTAVKNLPLSQQFKPFQNSTNVQKSGHINLNNL